MQGHLQESVAMLRLLRGPLRCKESPQATWMGSSGVLRSSDVFLRLCDQQSHPRSFARHVRGGDSILVNQYVLVLGLMSLRASQGRDLAPRQG